MLKIAVPNKGMLSEPAWDLLKEAGYRLRTNARQLVVEDPNNGIQLFYLRPLDIAVYVGSGIIDLGITGRDMLLNSETDAIEQMPLGFGDSTFRFAAPNESNIMTVEDLDGKRIATSFDKVVADYMENLGLKARIVHLDGAVESSVQLGVADAIADVVSTGTTLRNAGLRIFGDPIVTSEAIVVRSPRIAENNPELVVFQRRLKGVLTAHNYVLMDYDIPVSKVGTAVAITPGFESPTVSPLHDSQWVAVRAMVPRSEVNILMDQLYEVGARAIIITGIQASRM
ncbi:MULTISPECIES: ATP phosphoribosyltransferase [Alloscardovia]|jgi:ATP phosphoribosyltransferase|uniref:ATP phosphoribosyltransferase n=1 Tax=Alloscardovia omnicolens TaxID=419015 RepID=A0A2I1M7C0_9BIFI|nr:MULTISPECIES: ATP phosphoribosyltransferase [Alloscardovia]MBS6346647.1 ATP phosphoribosyltransferase [Alloscardovia omnicolens]MDK6248908.1 ATP phosphoribosyltransferase [Alloscardovia omnicolens]MDK6250470.1 ATP phosphoribosyltransferase [Alloscardovia omnicolens]MDK6328069.1 ATP phosphoribosyltransferase [Alloscardovia omnicolens]MDK6444402.1 ATP phosphoribosyltransferase [Alloscardovia omnicolens]